MLLLLTGRDGCRIIRDGEGPPMVATDPAALSFAGSDKPRDHQPMNLVGVDRELMVCLVWCRSPQGVRRPRPARASAKC